MKQITPYIAGLFFFLLLIGSDLIFHNLYYERSSQRLERCYERNNQTAPPGNVCSELNDTANLAYSSATANHIVTYFGMFMLFWLLTLRLGTLEKRLKDVEGRSDV